MPGFLKPIAAVLLAGAVLVGCAPAASPSVTLNDVHSRLNATQVAEYHEPASRDEIVALVKRAGRSRLAVSISGGRHSMGGQQFGEGTLHVNLSRYNRVVGLDEKRGLVTVESGIQWPQLIDWLVTHQQGRERSWGIRQKQTGADQLTIGGALSTNVHGRGLKLRPIVADVESFELVDAEGKLQRCSRQENPELFRLAIGGYGLFGVITEVTLRLAPRTKLERKVEVIRLPEVPARVEQRIQDGFEYGDFQFKTDEKADDFLQVGVFSFYRPVPASTPMPAAQQELSEDRWNDLYVLAHMDKSKAFQVYADYYLSTEGQIYWSDTHQLSSYSLGLDGKVDGLMGARAPGSLMIGEFYVPRDRLPDFLTRAGEVLRATKANLVYGTVRYIEKDDESFLAWARERYVCIVMNLRVTHDDAGIEAAGTQFQAVIDVALDMGGSYFLTYHRWARKDQVLEAYPQFPEFLRRKLRFDPEERFQSEWYRHYRTMFASEMSRP
ncbi:MAG: FAD-binding oxidoreductase [Candidatus Polarisedimenticolia bacterium]